MAVQLPIGSALNSLMTLLSVLAQLTREHQIAPDSPSHRTIRMRLVWITCAEVGYGKSGGVTEIVHLASARL